MGVEVVLGFAFGYWVGTRQGRKGMLQAIDAAQAIWASPETRRMLAEGLSAFQEVAPALGRGRQRRQPDVGHQQRDGRTHRAAPAPRGVNLGERHA